MAGERTGITYEAVLFVVLQRLKSKKTIGDNIFWNETPDGISVKPDFSIGPDKNTPKLLFMVTHSTSAKNDNIKCWRNIGEFCEAKTVLSSDVVAFNVVFDSAMNIGLRKLQSSVFDISIFVDEKAYGSIIKDWVKKYAPSLPTEKEEKATFIINSCKTQSEFAEAIRCLEEDIEVLIKNSNGNTSNLWKFESERKQLQQEIRDNKITSIRRGLSKLMIFENINLAVRLYRGKKVRIDEIPQYLFTIGLARKTIGKAEPSDSEIKNVFELLDDASIVKLYHELDDVETVQGWIKQLRAIDNEEIKGLFFIQNYKNLCNPDYMLTCINELHDNPCALIEVNTESKTWPPNDVWLISYMIEMIKAQSRMANGYGIAQLAQDVVASGYGTPEDLSNADQFGGGLGFTRWVARRDSNFRTDLVPGIATVLSRKLVEIGINNLEKLVESKLIEKTTISSLVEPKLCCYPVYAPLYSLLEMKIPSIRKVTLKTCFAEMAGLDRNAGNATVAQIQNTIVFWKTATDSGKDHKRNELCGRAVGIRYTWDSQREHFIKRQGVKKLILLVDGTWRKSDLETLVKAGWDEIYYPDEIDKLKAAIV